jgi:uncharacterized protein (TIGR02598 family)
MTLSPQKLPARIDGFSLVEVSLALAIFAFAIIGLLGLLPNVVTTHKAAKEDTVLSQIKQRLWAEVLFTDGTKLTELDNFERGFDSEGRELLNPTDPMVVYRGKIKIEEFTPPGANSPSNSLQRIQLFAVHDPTRDGAILRAAKPSASVLVAKAESASNTSGAVTMSSFP